MKGNDRVWGGGKVTVDRSDFKARGDSLRLDTGVGSDGSLLGTPSVEGLGADAFTLTGTRIDLKLAGQELKYVTALGNGHAVNDDMNLVADTIGLDVTGRQLSQTVAWGDSLRPQAVSTDYEIRADSLAFDSPDQKLNAMRAFGRAWVGGKPDADTKERDWMSGDSVVARFAQYDSAGTPHTTLAHIEARGAARSYYRIPNARTPGRPSLSYSRGDLIAVQMKSSGSHGVERVDIRGAADGVQLQPVEERPDSSAKDSTAADSTAADSTPRRRSGQAT
jgi:hypothetical protein